MHGSSVRTEFLEVELRRMQDIDEGQKAEYNLSQDLLFFHYTSHIKDEKTRSDHIIRKLNEENPACPGAHEFQSPFIYPGKSLPPRRQFLKQSPKVYGTIQKPI